MRTQKTKESQTMEKMSKLIIEGVIVSARYGATKFDDTNKYRLAIKSDNIPYDDIHAYDNVGTKLTPSWFKNQDGYMNLSSIYAIPLMDVKGKKITFEDWINDENDYNVLGSLVRISVKQKDGAIYPEAIKVLEEGEERDPFTDL